MTNEELKKYEDELYILKAEAMKYTFGKIPTRNEMKRLKQIGIRMKVIQNILEKAKQEALNRENAKVSS